MRIPRFKNERTHTLERAAMEFSDRVREELKKNNKKLRPI